MCLRTKNENIIVFDMKQYCNDNCVNWFFYQWSSGGLLVSRFKSWGKKGDENLTNSIISNKIYEQVLGFIQ